MEMIASEMEVVYCLLEIAFSMQFLQFMVSIHYFVRLNATNSALVWLLTLTCYNINWNLSIDCVDTHLNIWELVFFNFVEGGKKQFEILPTYKNCTSL